MTARFGLKGIGEMDNVGEGSGKGCREEDEVGCVDILWEGFSRMGRGKTADGVGLSGLR